MKTRFPVLVLAGRIAHVAVSDDMRADEVAHTGLLKPSAVAARLAVSRTWLYDAAKAGRIPAIRVGGANGPLRFVPEDVELWLAEARAGWLPGRGPVATRGRTGDRVGSAT
jgi:excisionase family DNA binding protein